MLITHITSPYKTAVVRGGKQYCIDIPIGFKLLSSQGRVQDFCPK